MTDADPSTPFAVQEWYTSTALRERFERRVAAPAAHHLAGALAGAGRDCEWAAQAA